MILEKITNKIKDFQPRLRLYFGALLLIFVLTLLYLKIVPSGQINYSRTWPRGLASGKGFIYNFKPGERMDITDPSLLKMIGDPLYFSLSTPRAFSTAKVTITYQDSLASSTPIIELGVLKDPVTGSYELKPVENKIIDQIASLWLKVPALENNNSQILLLQKNDSYPNLESFLEDLNSRNLRDCPNGPESCLAIYNYNFVSNYQPNEPVAISIYTFDHPVRGAHQLYLYLPAGQHVLSLSAVDLNLDTEPDPIIVKLSQDGREVASHTLLDDREELNGIVSHQLNIEVPVFSQGNLFKLDLRASDDIVISSLTFPTDRFVFINRIWPVSGKENFQVFTDASHLQIKTFNPASLGTISYGGNEHEIDQTYKQINLFSDQAVSEIIIPQDDIIIETNGVFSLTKQGIFNPTIPKIDRFFKLSSEVKYVLANYQRPSNYDNVKQSSAELTLADADRQDGKYTFLISVPGLGADTPDSFLEINKITVELRGVNIWQKIKSWMSN